MFNTFEEVETHLRESRICKTVVVAGAQDNIALSAVVQAAEAGFVKPILVGDGERIQDLLRTLGKSVDTYEIIDEEREISCAMASIELVREGRADFPMKGLMQTSSFLMAVRNPAGGIVDENSLLNEVTVFEYTDQGRMVVVGDCAVNIAPDLQQKREITENLVKVARAYGRDTVKVAAVSVVEKPNPTIPSSMDAAELAKMEWDEGIVVEGPFGLDNALDADAARHKGIESDVAGQADVLLMPDISGGNLLHKAIHFFGHYRFSSGLVGGDMPIIMNSRTDDVDAKYCSILSAVLLAERGSTT